MSSELKTGLNFAMPNLIRFVKPFVPLLPQVRSPNRSPSLREKFIWTGLAILIYLVACQIPLYGIATNNTRDHVQWLKVLIASSRGTLMDLGIAPIVTTSILVKGINLFGLIKVDYSVKEDKILYDCFEKIITILLTFAQAIVQIFTGFYGSYETLSKQCVAIIIFQLIISGFIIILLDELLQKGYGFGNGVNLFIVANVCERIIWNALSPRVFHTGRGLEFEGSLVSVIHIFFARRNKFSAIYEIFFRENLPNISSLIFTVLVFAFVIYIHAVRVELPLISRKHKGIVSSYPIALMYCSTQSVNALNTVVAQFFNVSRFLFKFFPNKTIVKLLGVWEMKPKVGAVPVSGLCYYIFPPNSYKDIFSRPIFFLIYCSIMLLASGFFTSSFVDSQEDTPAQVFKRIKDQDMQLRGIRDNNAVEKLNEYIPTAAFLSGILTCSVILFCDLFPVVGSGSNVFLAASIINQYMNLMAKESARKSGKAVIE